MEQRIDQVAGRPALRDCNVLMIYPRFQANNFWNYAETCKLIGAKCPTAPLGLITAAAMLPANWNVRLVNRNSENVRDEDFAWADMVMTGGMFNQQLDALRLIALAHQHGKPTVVGGPDATSSPHVYEAADFRVLGEVEDVIARFIAAWNAGERGGCFTAEKFQIDVSTTPARVHGLYGAGMCVTAGFIVGFDTEKVSVADAMVDLIEEAAIPAAMVGLLWALPNTQLTRRREKGGGCTPITIAGPTSSATNARSASTSTACGRSAISCSTIAGF